METGKKLMQNEEENEKWIDANKMKWQILYIPPHLKILREIIEIMMKRLDGFVINRQKYRKIMI